MPAAGDSAEHMLNQRGHMRGLVQRAQLGDGVIDGSECPGKGALHDLERECGGTQANRFVQVLENNHVLTDGISSPRPAVSYLVADHSLQLESDVLDDVGAIGAALEANDESAGLANAAAVIPESRHCLHE